MELLFQNCRRGMFFLFLPVAFALGASNRASAYTFNVIHTFTGRYGEGVAPEGGLMIDGKGNLFGTTAQGGGHSAGTIFELQKKHGAWELHSLYAFCPQGRPNCTDGWSPYAAPIVDTAGNLYGTTPWGGKDSDNGYMGNGVAYELSPNADHSAWTLKVLYNFCSQKGCSDGKQPLVALTYSGAAQGFPYDGVSPLYGVTHLGGNRGDGAIYQLNPAGGDWQESVIYSFCRKRVDNKCLDGLFPGPEAALAMDAKGSLYGTTTYGGSGLDSSGSGVVYKLVPNSDGSGWHERVLYNFCLTAGCPDGEWPNSGLLIDPKGNLFGTTSIDGKYGGGVAFELSIRKKQTGYTVLNNFCGQSDCADGVTPWAGLVLDSAGNLFGTTYFGGGNDEDQMGWGAGTVFELEGGSSFSKLHSFCSEGGYSCTDGIYPIAPLAISASGKVYGTALEGGGSSYGGVIFEIAP